MSTDDAASRPPATTPAQILGDDGRVSHRQFDDRLSLENRITDLESTVKNFKWFIGVGLTLLGVGATVVFLLFRTLVPAA